MFYPTYGPGPDRFGATVPSFRSGPPRGSPRGRVSMDGKTLMASHSARDDLDAGLDALLRAVPPEQREEVRAHLQTAHDPALGTHAIAHRLALTPPDAVHAAAGYSPSAISALAPVPALTPEHLAQIARDLVRTVLRLPAPVTSAPRAKGLVP